MSPALQIKLLRTLQEREVMRVGGNHIIHVDVRIVAATNEALERKVREGTFRRDLYYRLNTLPAVIPPLTERGDDMFLLMEQFRRELNGDFRLTEPVQDFFRRHTWPGNIRELRNVVEYFIYTDHRDITMEDLPPPCCSPGTPSPVRRLPRQRSRTRRPPLCRIPSGSCSPSCMLPPKPGRPWAGTSCCKRPGSPMFPSLSRRSGPSSPKWRSRVWPGSAGAGAAAS